MTTLLSFPTPSVDGKEPKTDRYNTYIRRANTARLLAVSSKLIFRATFLLCLFILFFFALTHRHNYYHHSTSSSSSSSDPLLHPDWVKQIRKSATPRRANGFSVLVTGAAGFVGTHSSLALKKRGDGVLGLDNFNSYYHTSLKRSRQALLASHHVFVVEADLNDAPLLSKLFYTVPFTHVLHLAAQAGVRYAMQNPQSYVRSNVAGFVTLLEAAKDASPQPAIVWASSSSVYGMNTHTPFSEQHRTDRPASLYAASKKAGEAIAHAYNHIYGLSLTGLRFFTVYGPWGRPDMAYFFFTKAMLEGRPISIYKTGDGVEVARDFTYIDDVVKGCVGAIDTAEKSTGGKRKKGAAAAAVAQLRVYNLGNTTPVTVGKLVGILEGLLGVKAKKRVVTMPSNGDVPFTHANVSMAVEELGYRPATDLGTGLRKFVKWYIKYYGIKSSKSSSGGGGGGEGKNSVAFE